MKSITGKAREQWMKEHPGVKPPIYSPNVERILANSQGGIPGYFNLTHQPWHEVVENPNKFRIKK